MSTIKNSWIGILLGLAMVASPAHTELLFPLSGEPTIPLNRGTTAQMRADLADTSEQPVNAPDRSFRKVWVRMFPILSTPLNDPYPETQNTNLFFMENLAGFNIYGLDDGQLLASGNTLEFDFKAAQVKVDGTAFALEPLWIQPMSTVNGVTALQWDKGLRNKKGKLVEVRSRVRGGVVIQMTRHYPKDNRPEVDLWSAINVVDVNDYLKSVVPSEVIAGWRNETLRAQAIAARTYGMYEVAVARQKGRDYDVDPTTWYQSYRGHGFWDRTVRAWRTVELTATSAAVDSTGNLVMQYQGEVIRAFFSSNSGGRTCTSDECLETSTNPPYLVAVDDAPGVRSAPGGSWGSRANLTRTSIRNKLREYGLKLPGTVRRLEHLEKGPTGRTWRLRVVLTNGKVVNLSREHTRKVMHLFGPIRSFYYTLGPMSKKGRQSIRGWGYGHGVGMSQWGAELFARSGKTAEQILQHYYYGIAIK